MRASFLGNEGCRVKAAIAMITKRKDVVTRRSKNGLTQDASVNLDSWNSQGEGC
jgi:hypothetical protein